MNFQDALGFVLDGEAMLFLGAGASTGCVAEDGRAFPRGQQLADELATLSGKPSGYSLSQISEYAISTLGVDAVATYLISRFTTNRVSTELIELAKYNWLRVYTTNYDDAFEKASSEAKVVRHGVGPADPIDQVQNKKRFVAHLNGLVSQITAATVSRELKLTLASYATGSLTASPWGRQFLDDVRRSRAIIVAGYSLYDLDIARLFIDDEAVSKRVFFIEPSGIDPVIIAPLKNFGSVVEVGLDGLVSEIRQKEANWKQRDLPKVYENFSEIEVQTPSQARDRDVFDLMMFGRLQYQYLAHSLLNPGATDYIVIRDFWKNSLEILTNSDQTLLFVSRLANGKTVSAFALLAMLQQAGYRCYVYRQRTASKLAEAAAICNATDKSCILVDGYRSALDVLEVLFRQRSDNVRILITERTEPHDLSEEKLRAITGGKYLQYDLDRLTNRDEHEFDSLMSRYGLWGDDANKAEYLRIKLIELQCGHSISGILSRVMRAPQIKERLDQLVASAQGHAGAMRVVALASVFQVLEFRIDAYLIGDLLSLPVFDVNSILREPSIRQVIQQSSGTVSLGSSSLSQFLLHEVIPARVTLGVLADSISSIDSDSRHNSIKRSISKTMMQYGKLEGLLPNSGKRDSLIWFYEQIKNCPSNRRHPHYWLQYAIARLAYDEYDMAGSFLNNAYSFAKDIPGYDTYYIDNTYARWLLSTARGADLATMYDHVRKASAIIRQQLRKKEDRYYPLRVARGLFDVWNDASKPMEKGLMKLLDVEATGILSQITDELLRHMAGRECQERLSEMTKAIRIEVERMERE